MKNNGFYKMFLFLITLSLVFGFTACSKSSKGKRGGSQSSEGNGFMFTVTDIPDLFNGEIINLLVTKEANYDDILAYGNGDIIDGKAEMYLFTSDGKDKPWTKAGNYYITMRLSPDYDDAPFIKFNLQRSGNSLEITEENSNIGILSLVPPGSIFKGMGEGWVPLAIWKEFGFPSGISKPLGAKVNSASEEGNISENMEYTEQDGKMVGYKYVRFDRMLTIYMNDIDQSTWASIIEDIKANPPLNWNEGEFRIDESSRGNYGVYSGSYNLDGVLYHANSTFSGSNQRASINISVRESIDTELTLEWPSEEFFAGFGLQGLAKPEGSEVRRKYGSFAGEYESSSSYEITIIGSDEAAYNKMKDQVAQKLKVTPYEKEGYYTGMGTVPSSTIFETEKLMVSVLHDYYGKFVGLEIRW